MKPGSNSSEAEAGEMLAKEYMRCLSLRKTPIPNQRPSDGGQLILIARVDPAGQAAR